MVAKAHIGKKKKKKGNQAQRNPGNISLQKGKNVKSKFH